MAITYREELSPREREEMDFQKEENEKNRQYNLEVARLENRWTQLFRLPLALLALPVKLVLAFALIAYVVKRENVPDSYWRALKF